MKTAQKQELPSSDDPAAADLQTALSATSFQLTFVGTFSSMLTHYGRIWFATLERFSQNA